MIKIRINDQWRICFEWHNDGVSVEFWTGIQTHYDTEMAKMALADRLEKEVKVLSHTV